MPNATAAVEHIPADPPLMLSRSAVRAHVGGISDTVFSRWLSSGEFPQPDIIISRKIQLWRRETLLVWIDSKSLAEAK